MKTVLIPPTDLKESVRLWEEFFERCRDGAKVRRAIRDRLAAKKEKGYGKQ